MIINFRQFTDVYFYNLTINDYYEVLKHGIYSTLIWEMSKIIASVGVKAVKNKRLIPSRAAIVLVSVRFKTLLSCSESISEMHLTCIRILLLLFFFQTKSAVSQIKRLLDGKPEFVSYWRFSVLYSDLILIKFFLQIGLKVGVKQRGCNGLSYTLDYAKEKGKLDEEVVQDGNFHFYTHL